MNETFSLLASAALSAFRLVRTVAGGAAYAPASTSYADGVLLNDVASGGQAEIKPLNAAGWIKCSASGAIGPGVLVYQAANGQVAASGTLIVGRSHPDHATVAANETIWVMVNRSAN